MPTPILLLNMLELHHPFPSGFTFDEGFFNMAQDNGYSESELKLVYRENASSSWSEHLNYELNTLAVDDDYIGRIDFMNLKPGDYAWGFTHATMGETEGSQAARWS